MAYFKIHNHYVYYDIIRFKELNQSYLNTLPPHLRIGVRVVDSHGRPSKEALELEKLQYEFLLNEYNRLGEDDFVDDWVWFDYEEHNFINNNLWDMIYDCLLINGYGEIVDTNNQRELFLSYYERDDYYTTYKMRPSIRINLEKKRINLFKSIKRNLDIHISPKEVVRIEGKSNELTIIMSNNSAVMLGEKIEVKL